ncbi:hypothetical protein [Lysinibacillus piscis]|uniref:DUF5626 domain-containing protein n=1 Tax=Lysinibacillus piscis TaxID=2518931 RepID=A0ABQ5NIB4_9BACI|nr:hypothetical protein [Lysinibacillus sp. KH24]GLC87858.1 hypothetical protein LYSBPC_09850 [Lysinibacillus sp. KH24]
MKYTSIIGKIALAGTIALGTIGTVSVVELSQPIKAEAAMLDYQANINSSSASTLVHNFQFTVDSSASHYGRTASWYIKDANSNVRLSGQSSINVGVSGNSGEFIWSTSLINTNISALPAGNYSILYIYNAGGTEFRATAYFSK